ncbi:hypothetical protein JCM16358_12930 [Halanaerocella petrolearia]
MSEGSLYNFLGNIDEEWPYKLDKIRMRLRLLGEQDWSEVDKYFIVSTGRTGTKFFAHFLNDFSGVYGVHEPAPVFLRLAINYATGKVTGSYATKKIERNRRALCRKVKKMKVDKYVESNNRLFSLLGPLSETFGDDFKVVHIVRDGRDYVRSGMSRNWYTESDGSRLRAIYFPDDPYYDQWNQMSRFEKICWRWQKKDGFIYQSVKEMDNAITVTFEDIFKDDNFKGIYRIADYIDLPKTETDKMIDKMMNRRVNSTKEYAIPKWTDWDQEMLDKFDEIAGEHMRNYYDY